VGHGEVAHEAFIRTWPLPAGLAAACAEELRAWRQRALLTPRHSRAVVGARSDLVRAYLVGAQRLGLS
jgi:hypothetical protein